MEAPFVRGINLYIKTDKVDALYKRVKDAKATIFLAMEEKWHHADNLYVGNQQFIALYPDGYLLRFFKDMGER